MKLSSRFSLLFGLLALGVAVLLNVFWEGLLVRASQDRAIRRLVSECSLLADLAGPRFSDPAGLDAFVRSSGKALGARVTAIEPSGRVISDSAVAPSQVPFMENHANRPEIAQARAVGTGSSRRFSATLDLDFIYLADRIDGKGRTAGFIRLAYPLDQLQEEESRTLWLGRAAIFGSCLVLFLVGHLASRRFSAPLRRVTEAALAVSRGDLARDAPEEDEPEAAALSEAVRRMKNSLLASLAEAETERRLTAAAFDRLPVGLVVVGEKSEIVQANSAFSRMLDCPDPAGRPLVDVVRDPVVHALFREAIESDSNREDSLVWKKPDEVTWEVDVLPLPRGTRGRAVGIFRDVTRLARTEAMRRRFVSDVSHELRTPVASIAAAAETLLEGQSDREESAHLTALIARQTRRMHELIEDLTDLSRMESGAIELVWEDVTLREIVEEVAQDVGPRAAERGVTIVVSGDPALLVSGDRRRLVQIIHNLLDNAVKFSPDSTPVEARVEMRAGHPVLTVSDRGPGIPRSERDRIFQRFYQVDPSRSKARPGTGLGLAIVKHLVLLHRAQVEVGGEPGEGAVFRVVFPEVRPTSPDSSEPGTSPSRA
ncbi:MAG: ATP-binding protein [Thermoanaerobaculia bacterium]